MAQRFAMPRSFIAIILHLYIISTLLFDAEQVKGFVTVQQFIAVKVQMLLEENIESQVIKKWLFIIPLFYEVI